MWQVRTQPAAASGANGDYVTFTSDDTGQTRVARTTCNTATLTNQTDQATNVTLAAANAARKGLLAHNDSPSILYLKYGATATTSSYTVKIAADGYWEMPEPIYVGIIDGIWSADSTGSVRLTELT